MKNQTDQPSIVSHEEYATRYGKRMSYDASSFFIQGKSYYEAAAQSPVSISPVLFYYGYLSLLSALKNMVCRTISPVQSHGLSIVWPEGYPTDDSGLKDDKIDEFLTKIAVRITPTGAFARARDTLSI